MAWLVDGSIRLAILIAISIIFNFSAVSTGGEYATIGLYLILQFLLNWFYTTAFEAMTGSTPGKRMFGLWVVHDNATPITWSGALIRNFLRVVDNLPFFYMTGLVTMLFDGRFRRLGDLAAGTLVIYRDKQIDSTAFTHDKGTPPPDWLNREERIAVVDFAERSRSLSPDRQQELAKVLDHIIDKDTDSVDTLKSWAYWIIRGQEDAQSKSI